MICKRTQYDVIGCLTVWLFQPHAGRMTTPALLEVEALAADIAAEIRSVMGRLNVNKAELSRRLGVEDSWVGKRLNCRTEIGVTDLGRIARALGVNVVDLLPRSQRTTVTPQYASLPPVTRVASTPRPDLLARVSTATLPPLERRTRPVEKRTWPTAVTIQTP